MALLASGCANVQEIDKTDEALVEKVLTPAVGETAKGTIGDTLIEQKHVFYAPGIKLRQSYETEWIRNGGTRAFPFSFEAGTELKRISTHNGVSIYSGPAKGGLIGLSPMIVGNYGIGVRDDGAVAYVQLAKGVIEETPGRSVKFDKTQVVDETSDSVKREFIYSGRTGDALYFTYREFLRDMARPAFTQNVTYNVKDGPIVGFKKLRLEVQKATNTEITYRLLSGF
ncbi:MAG: hypothetical protein OEL53_12460 [Rhodospirillales bacterium]|nr:hypothetical protein [Rhodospirillales bacterium]